MCDLLLREERLRRPRLPVIFGSGKSFIENRDEMTVLFAKIYKSIKGPTVVCLGLHKLVKHYKSLVLYSLIFLQNNNCVFESSAQ